MFVPFGTGAYERSQYGLAPVILENWYTEISPDNPIRTSRLIPAPGLADFVATGFTGLDGGLYQSDGVLGGDIVAIAGTEVHRVTKAGALTTLTGAVERGDVKPMFAGTQTPELVAVTNGKAYTIGDSTVTEFTWSGPTGPITSVASEGQRHFFTEGGSGRVWYSEVADATNVTQFITAESDPDEAKVVVSFAKTIWIFGSKRTEAVYLTGDSTVPVAFRPSVDIEIGIASAGAQVKTSKGVFFVGHDSRVYSLGSGQPVVVSSEPIVGLLEGVADRNQISMDYYRQADHEWIVLRIPGYSEYFYDVELGQWHTRPRATSIESGLGSTIEVDGKVYCLDNVSSGNTALLEVVPGVYTNRGAAIVRRATAQMPNEDEELNVSALAVECQTGTALDGNALGSQPKLLLQVAQDGQEFEAPIERDLGAIGEYRHRVIYGPLGVFRPGIITAQISMGHPVGLTVTGAVINPKVRR